MKKRILAILLCSMLVLAFPVGCSWGDDQPADAPETEADADALPTAGTTLRAPIGKPPEEINFGLSLGWTGNESGANQRQGFIDAVEEMGGNLTIVETEFDPRRQVEQIEALIEQDIDALFVTPSDPMALTDVLNLAIERGIPVFTSDAFMAGVPVTTAAYFDNFSAGKWNMEVLARKMGGSGQIAIIELPQNDAWDARWRGAQYTLQFYPDIEVVGIYAYDPTGATTPRAAADVWLTQFPELGGIWAAWDDAAMQSLQAIRAAGREGETFVTGTDGGEIAFATMMESPSFISTATQQVRTMTYQVVFYAHQYLQGERVPRFIVNGIGVTREMLLEAYGTVDFPLHEYDILGNISYLGWSQGFINPTD